MKPIVCIAMLAVSLTLSGCDDAPDEHQVASAKNAPRSQMRLMAAAPQSNDSVERSQEGLRMEIARNYAIEITAGTVADALQVDQEACVRLDCVVTAVNVSEQYGEPSASLNAFVPQANAAAFHELLMNTPNRVVTSFNETAQNRDDQYQDIKARVERLEFMRRRLYLLADQKSDKVGELLQVERELMRVETDIERLTRDRKGIEKVTDNVRFSISYTVRPPKAGDVSFGPFKGLLSDIANTFIRAVSLTALWLAQWLPVALLGLGVLWVVRRRWR